ncbi:MAG: hypothetical protein KDK54_03830 [Leptospiraceae bacterium]|nr:hypothetical protein [Leptospiraceae bacterium]
MNEIKSNELHPVCPLYIKKMDKCPSGKDFLSDADMNSLTTICSSKKHETCKIFLKAQEKAA